MNTTNTVKHSSSRTYPTFGIWIMVLSVAFFTAHVLSLKWLMSFRDLHPTATLLFRAIVGSLVVFALFSKASGKRRPLVVRPIFCNVKLIYRGIVGLLGTLAFYYTIPAMGIGKASLLLSTYVLFAAVIAVWFLKEPLGASQALWLVIAFIGVALLLSNHQGVFNLSLGFYEILGLSGALMAASTVVLIRDLTKQFSAGTIFLTQCIWIGIPILPFALKHCTQLSLIDYLGLIATGLMAAGGQLCMNEGFRKLPVTVGSSIQNTTTVFITVGGIFVFGEFLSLLQISGGVLILLGAWFVSRRKK